MKNSYANWYVNKNFEDHQRFYREQMDFLEKLMQGNQDVLIRLKKGEGYDKQKREQKNR